MEQHFRVQVLCNMQANMKAIVASDSSEYVEQLLKMFNRFSKFIRDAFDDDVRILACKDKVTSGPPVPVPTFRKIDFPKGQGEAWVNNLSSSPATDLKQPCYFQLLGLTLT
jgi:hypothetical protein